MSFFSCLEHIAYLKAHYPAYQFQLDTYEQQLMELHEQDDASALLSVICKIKEDFPDIVSLHPWMPQLWLPFNRFSFEQRIRQIHDELTECLHRSRQRPHAELTAFQLPQGTFPWFSSAEYQKLYQNLTTELQAISLNIEPGEILLQWQNFDRKTRSLQQQLEDTETSWYQRYQAKRFLERRHAVSNQLALVYYHHQFQQAKLDLSTDWRYGSDQSDGYGYVMALASHKYNPVDGDTKLCCLDDTMAKIEKYRQDGSKDQLEIKHNRILPISVATTVMRCEKLLALAKAHPGSNLNIHLFSRSGLKQRFTYLRYQTTPEGECIYFADPTIGLYQFKNAEDFKFFYQMHYAKEQMQTGNGWNRFQASVLIHSPQAAVKKTWRGALRSILYGTKYNSSILDYIKNFVLFNITLFVSLIAAYSLVSVVALVSEAANVFLMTLLAHDGASILLGFSCFFGSAGLLAIPEFARTLFFSGLDVIKSCFGLPQSHEEILYQDFSADGIEPEARNQSVVQILSQMPKVKMEAELKPDNAGVFQSVIQETKADSLQLPEEITHHSAMQI